MSTTTQANTGTSHGEISLDALLQDALACGVMLVDARGTVSFMSAETPEMLGSSLSPAPAAQVEVLPAPLRELIRDVLTSGKPLTGRQLELPDAAGKTLTLWASAMPIPEGTGSPGAVVVLNDISSAQRLEQNLAHQDRLASIGTLSASMAHEIRNALVAGKTFFDLLIEKHQEAELAEVARREISRIEAIVTRMLKFAGPAEPAFREVRLHETLEHSLRLVQPRLGEKSISVTRSFQAAPDVVSGDDLRLQQAFVNLFLNALEAMGPDGKLTVATETRPPGGGKDARADGQLVLTIEDTGSGIAPENLARLFEPFFTTKPSGTGLGLHITRRIVQEHRGQIIVHSTPGEGSTFRITFPLLNLPT